MLRRILHLHSGFLIGTNTWCHPTAQSLIQQQEKEKGHGRPQPASQGAAQHRASDAASQLPSESLQLLLNITRLCPHLTISAEIMLLPPPPPSLQARPGSFCPHQQPPNQSVDAACLPQPISLHLVPPLKQYGIVCILKRHTLVSLKEETLPVEYCSLFLGNLQLIQNVSATNLCYHHP